MEHFAKRPEPYDDGIGFLDEGIVELLEETAANDPPSPLDHAAMPTTIALDDAVTRVWIRPYAGCLPPVRARVAGLTRPRGRYRAPRLR